jgi:hypothetical protein
MRVKHKKDYWEMQTQVENQYIQQHKMERIAKYDYDMVNWRN